MLKRMPAPSTSGSGAALASRRSYSSSDIAGRPSIWLALAASWNTSFAPEILDQVAHFLLLEPPGDRHGLGAEHAGGADQLVELRAVLQRHANAVARADAELAQHGHRPRQAAAIFVARNARVAA